jgi:hypothetical protein
MTTEEEKQLIRKARRKTLFSFAVFFGMMVLALYGWKYLRSQPKDNGVLKPLRTVLDANEKVNSAFYSNDHKAPEYSKKDAVKKARVNGHAGLGKNFDVSEWSMLVAPDQNGSSRFYLNMKDITSLPKREVIFDFKCIEGWSQVTYWGGVRFSDFMMKYKLGTKSGKAPDPENHPEDLYKYVGLMTPDSAYYVGIDMKSMLHPQTILCYELNEKPLPDDQGAPLRLIITVKYGVKSLKRIGYIYFSDTRPPDYWHKRGYDYDSAL